MKFMSVLHLLWIVPLTGMIGVLIGCMVRVSSEADKKIEELLNK